MLGGGSWSATLRQPNRSRSPGTGWIASTDHPDEIPHSQLSWDLIGVGAPQAWKHGRARGVGIAVIDTGVDVNHVAISPNLRMKENERPGDDGDGNGVPGDWAGLGFAHFAIVRGEGAPHLVFGRPSDVADWDGADTRYGVTGHGTAIAAAAAGAGGPGGRFGVAPDAWILPVDVQENLRVTASRLGGDDPRSRVAPVAPDGRTLDPPLRASVWARAAGVAYAVSEGARVLTCAWPATKPHWILHDALLYAEDNCVTAVCATKEELAAADAPMQGYPERWRSQWLRSLRLGNGDLYDVWTDTL